MNRWTIPFLLAVLLLAGSVMAQEATPDSELGLSKESVFTTPDPILAIQMGGEPGENGDSVPYFQEMPPMIPHLISDFLPIKASENACLDCHELPDEIGKPLTAGDPVPLPSSPYKDLRSAPDKMAEEVERARWVCVQCHAPQTDAKPLVVNTYVN